ncbi:putative inositol polyphosphate 5-phosphatase C9G1.10c [Cladobotryum mycophilum]|uniref:Inositol polyphosphate 5-phosphatase C9G1.10c n=1 Tax=Cladobotryum mycophilum TaxID=491253 RepID=A0ABR0SP68_9HYPO
MDSVEKEGDRTDGSSIKPVSSLLARFENMNKLAPAPPSATRPISPGPKPDKLRTFNKNTQDAAPPTPIAPAKPSPFKDRVVPATPAVNHDRAVPAPPPPISNRPPPTIPKSQSLAVQPPAVTVQPPQSPPKVGPSSIAPGEHSPFLDPVSIGPSSTNSSGAPTPIRIPSRPLTPTTGASTPRSPRQGPSAAPSPPPPRRSTELKRDREAKSAPPPPAPRLEKPRIPSVKTTGATEVRSHPTGRRGELSREASPFNSPPASPSIAAKDETPPELPTRPRPPVQNDALNKAKQMAEAFEAPALRRSLSVQQRGRDVEFNGFYRGAIAPQLTGEPRPALPARPQVQDTSLHHAHQAMKPPPKPPRPAAPMTAQKTGTTPPPPPASSQASTYRAVSNPTTQTAQHLPAPPGKSHGRSKTMDPVADRASSDTHNIAASDPVVAKPVQMATVSEGLSPSTEPPSQVVTYPDASSTNRRPPFIKKGCYEILPKYDPRIFDVCGPFVCTSGHLTRVWNLLDGEQLVSLQHTEGVRATAVSFKPAADPDQEGNKLWIGTNQGEIMEVEVETHRILNTRPGAHGKSEITKIYRHLNELWSVDEGGNLHVWGPGNDGEPSLNGNPARSFKLPKGETFSLVVGDELWQATGKAIRVFAPTPDGRTPFQVFVKPLMTDGAGDVTCGALLKTHPDKIFFGHIDGKISIYSTADYSCKTVINVTTGKINTLAGVGQYLWAGYNTGRICVYDIAQSPWVVLKEWQAHENSVLKLQVDFASSFQLDQLQVVSLGTDSKIKVWDGMLQDDWLEDEMKSKDTAYCDFDEISALIFSWNAGASTPHSLRYSDGDATFFQDLVQSSGSPDILVFGFQELVDLEDKTATAKRLLKSKKKEGTDQERMSHQYRDWRDFLLKTLDDYMPRDDLYHLLHTAPMVGLFTCIFVKSSLRARITDLSGAEVKRGMGGLHGNKGAVCVRFRVDDTSICFTNCHLAAGQTQASSRHNDAAAILEAGLFPIERDPVARIDTFCGGGDGTMILDHELSILNGDLNYRIDTMSRDTVVKAVQQNNLSKLLERDQLLVARRRNPTLRLRAFDELPITFAPTYKYDVGTDTYDTSEKRRSPAWCDRLLFRGRGRVQQLDYRRHEVRVSDHRPITGNFRLWVKKIKPKERAQAWMECQQGFEEVRQRELEDEK